MAKGKYLFLKIKNQSGNTITDRYEITKIATEFYHRIYSNENPHKNNFNYWGNHLTNRDEIPTIQEQEVREVLNKLKSNRAPSLI